MRVRGAALVLVLWLITLLTALVGTFALISRVEAMQGKVLTDGTVAQEAARAGMEYSLVRISDTPPGGRWPRDGRVQYWQFSGHSIEVSVQDESGKVDINHADATLLSALMRAVGTESADADQLAAAILDWRDPDDLKQPSGGAEDPEYAEAGRHYGAKDAPFETLAELQQVLGMTPLLYAKLSPYLTIHSGRSLPDQTYAPVAVLTAMGLEADRIQAWREAPDNPGALGGGSGTYGIRSVATRENGRMASLHVVVRMGARNVPGSAYTILQWQEGEGLR